MESSSGDDYGELDYEDIVTIVTQVEGGRISPPTHRAHKRRKLNGSRESPADVGRGGKSERSQESRSLTSLGRVSPINDKKQDGCRRVQKPRTCVNTGRVSPIDDLADGDEVAFQPSALVPSSKRNKDAVVDNETDTPKRKSKSKYRIHVPKRADVPKNTFFTQPPPASSSPYRIRGPIWQKVKRPPHEPDDRLSPDKPQSSDEEEAFDPSPQPVRTSAQHVAESHHSSEEEDAFDPNPHLQRGRRKPPDEFAESQSDVFASPSPSKGTAENSRAYVPSQPGPSPRQLSQRNTSQSGIANQTNLRQTTLFGATAPRTSSLSQTATRHNWPLATQDEAPTHHKIDRRAMETWIYPTNLGTIRDYQFNIVQRGLFHNLLVALPTGLGKTFIAATVMLNWFRWTVDSQIIFVAPTKPLVAQQVEACFSVAGIPRSATTMLTGEITSRLRSEEYLTKRVFFMTPQTLMNDLSNGNCDPKKIVLLVVDEAHRATGNYSYVQIVKLLRRFNKSFRVLALTATPGASVEAVQEVIDGLDIARVEIRTESSIDIRQYVHSRKIDTQIFDYSDEIEMLMNLWAKTLQPVLNKLNGMNAYWMKDPIALTPFGLTKARQAWMATDAGKKANMGVKGMVNTIFTLLSSRAHATELLKFHGIGPFYHNLLAFRDSTQPGEKGSKYRKEIIENEHFHKLMNRMQGWVRNLEFVGHPKLEYLRTVVLNHFLDAGDGKGATDGEPLSSTRIMVFVHYRDSAEEVARVLKRHEPMIRPHVFVGQANSKGSDGMDQKRQLEIIKKFKEGEYNTIVATSIGEEGLDIGEVDLIVCYDSSASPIRMLQRMGRTGRKRAGNIVVLLMRGKEEKSFTSAKDNYEKMQKMIAEGSRFTFHHDLSTRIVPRDIQPTVNKKSIDIPPENTQPGLPEPKRLTKPSKKKAKKFHMPDGVETGFTKASRLSSRADIPLPDYDEEGQAEHITPTPPEPSPEPIPTLEEVSLGRAQQQQLERTYLDIGGDTSQVVEIPRVDAFPMLQRTLRHTKHVGHGRSTQRIVKMLNRMHGMDLEKAKWFEQNLHPEDKQDLQSWQEAPQAGPGFDTSTTSSRPGKTIMSPSAGSSRRLRNPRNIPTSDDSVAGEADDLSGVVVDDSQEEDAQGAGSSVITSSAPLHAPEKPFYTPLGEKYGAGSDSEEDLPEFGNLVQKNGFISAATLAKDKGNKDVVHASSERRGKRRVIQDDSDDE